METQDFREPSPPGDPSPPADSPPAAPRRWLRWIIAAVLVLVVAGIVYESVTFLNQPPVRRGRFGDAGGPQSVGVATIATGDIHVNLRALGAVTPLTTVTVNSQISGLLMEVGFKEGQSVHKGQFLAQIDPRPYQVALEQDMAQQARDEATLKQAQMDLSRYETLAQQQSLPKQTAEDQVWVVRQDQATVNFDKAQVKAQQLNLTYCHILAPADGRVGLRLIDPGNYVQAGSSTGVVVLTLLDPISVVFSVPEDSVPKILQRIHAGAKLPVVAYDRANVNKLAVGAYSAIDNEVDTTTGTVKLRAQFDNAAGALFPSQFVNVTMLLETLDNVVRVPVAAVQRGAPGTYVYLVGGDNKVVVHPIVLGPQDGDFFAVDSGLSTGDRVVTDGADRLRDGAIVNIPGAAAAGAGADKDVQTSGTPSAGRHRRRDGGTQGGNGSAQGGNGSAQGGSDADAAARREKWRQRRQQEQQAPTGQPSAQ